MWPLRVQDLIATGASCVCARHVGILQLLLALQFKGFFLLAAGFGRHSTWAVTH